nr:hypothetical protein [uncultured Undibacterium sp.]
MINLILSLLITLTLHSISYAKSSFAEKDKLTEYGVWVGTLGGQQIMACFENLGDSDSGYFSSIPNRSSYFYLKYSKPISLRQKEGEREVWEEISENKITGEWQIKKVTERTLDVNWRATDSGKVIPMILRRFEDLSGYRESCVGEDGIHNPYKNQKFYKAKVNQGLIQEISNKKYRLLNIEKMNASSLELLEDIPARKTLNFFLKNQLRTDAYGNLACRNPNDEEIEDVHSSQSDSNSSVAPVFWNDRWISLLNNVNGDCGGASPFSFFSYSTWDTQSGKVVHLWEWFQETRIGKLHSLIVKKAVKSRRAFNGTGTEKDSCIPEIKENTKYQLHLSTKGVIFSHDFPRYLQACNDNIELSFSELKPYLSEQGHQAVHAITR